MEQPDRQRNEARVGDQGVLRNEVRQARYWILTIPYEDWNHEGGLPAEVQCIIGQGETAPTTGFRYEILIINILHKDTGKLSSHSSGQLDSQLSRESLELVATQKSHVLKQQYSMFKKKIQELKAVPSNSDHLLLNGILQMIGKQYGKAPSQEDYLKFPQTFVYVAITRSAESIQIIRNLLPWLELPRCSGAQLVQGKVGELFMKQENFVMLSVPGPNGGVDTKVKKMWSLMNLEAISQLITCSGGSIVTLSLWKQKEAQDLSWPCDSSSPLTCIQGIGSQDLIPSPIKRLKEE
jgi:hypothetical protein